MTIEEIENLIHEYGDACMEWQSYIEEAFEDDDPEAMQDNIKKACKAVIEAIKQYGDKHDN